MDDEFVGEAENRAIITRLCNSLPNKVDEEQEMHSIWDKFPNRIKNRAKLAGDMYVPIVTVLEIRTVNF